MGTLVAVGSACSSGDPGGPSSVAGSSGQATAGNAVSAGSSTIAGSGGVGGTDVGGSSAAGAALGGVAGAISQAGSGASLSVAGMASAGSGGAARISAYPAAAGAGDTEAALEQLNRYRATLGLGSVKLDAASSVGCEGHLRYLIEESTTRGQRGYLEHTETNHDNSHYSVANEQAGKDSDLAWGQSGGMGENKGQSLGQAVDLWINGVYHRRPLLEPGLTKVGAASIEGYNCLNYRAAGNTVVMKLDEPVLWPANGMTDVPRSFGGNEGPCPTNPTNPLAAGTCAAAGFIISATYYNWGTNRASALTSVASVTLTNSATGAVVPLLTWYADGVSGHDPAPGYMRDEIALVPQAALPANTEYRVDVDAVVSGKPAMLSWSFTTGARNQ